MRAGCKAAKATVALSLNIGTLSVMSWGWGVPFTEAQGDGDANVEFVPRSFDGTGNNVNAPAWGAVGTAQVSCPGQSIAALLFPLQ